MIDLIVISFVIFQLVLTSKPHNPTWTVAPANHWPPSQGLQIQIVLIYTTFKSFLFCTIYIIVSQHYLYAVVTTFNPCRNLIA